METKVIIENTTERYINELQSANDSIEILASELQNTEIVNVLLLKTKQGIRVKLFFSAQAAQFWQNHLQSGGIDVQENGFQLVQSEVDFSNVCLIDNSKLLIGSYAFDNGAKRSVLVSVTDTTNVIVAVQNSLSTLSNFAQGQEHINNQLIERLKLLKTTLKLEDLELSLMQVNRIHETALGNVPQFEPIIHQIKQKIEALHFSAAASQIEEIINKNDSLMYLTDTDSILGQLSIKELEMRTFAIESELAESKKMIHNFERTYNTMLNDSMVRLLNLRIQKLELEAKDNPLQKQELEEAINERNEFLNSIQFSKKEKRFIVDKKRNTEITKLFRKASKLCHPDLVSEKQAADAKEIFEQIRQAYDANDYDRLERMYLQLKKGFFAPKLYKVTDFQALQTALMNLKEKSNAAENEYFELRFSKSFETVKNINDWAAFFEDKLAHINAEIHKYETNIGKINLN